MLGRVVQGLTALLAQVSAVVGMLHEVPDDYSASSAVAAADAAMARNLVRERLLVPSKGMLLEGVTLNEPERRYSDEEAEKKEWDCESSCGVGSKSNAN